MKPYLMEAKYESLRCCDAPVVCRALFVIPVLRVRADGCRLFRRCATPRSKASMYVFAGLTVFGMMGPGMFSFGVAIAQEREHGLLKLKRALPLPQPDISWRRCAWRCYSTASSC